MFFGLDCSECCSQDCIYVSWGLTSPTGPTSCSQNIEWPVTVSIPERIDTSAGVDILFSGGYDDKGRLRYQDAGGNAVDTWGGGSPSSCGGAPPSRITTYSRSLQFFIVDTVGGFIRLELCICVSGASAAKADTVPFTQTGGGTVESNGWRVTHPRYDNLGGFYSNINQLRSCGPIQGNPLP
jgi:hypothetical protein